MSTSDKTGERLVDSMRKTKAAASDSSGPSQGEAPQARQRTSGAEPKGKRPAKRPCGGTRGRRRDPYQSGRRIWPD